MANIKTITKKLVATGKYSEYELSLMTEKEIRETFKTVKEESKEEKTMENAQITTINNKTTVREEITMTRLQKVLMNGTKTERMVQVLEFCREVTKKQDDRYVDKTTLAKFLFDNDIIGRRLSKTELKKTKRDTLIETLEEAVNNLIKAGTIIPVNTDCCIEDYDLNYEAREYGIAPASVDDLPKTADVIIENPVVQTMNNENNIPVPVVANATPVAPICGAQGKIYPELNPELTPVKAAPVKVQNATPVDAKVKTYNFMHLIGDHALDQKKKGYGTCISAYMVCAYIMQVEYGIKNLKNWMGKHEVTDEMKATVKRVRNWLIENGYLTVATFKDEKGFSFFTHEYDGQGSPKMWDATKYKATGNKTTTTYRVTKEMNKWYQK